MRHVKGRRTPCFFRVSSPQLKSQHLPNAVPHFILVLAPTLPPHLRCFYVCGTLVVGLGEHAHYGDEDLLDRLNR